MAFACNPIGAFVAYQVLDYVCVNGHDDGPYTLLKSPEDAQKWLEKFPDCTISDTAHVSLAEIHLSHVLDYANDMTAAWQIMRNMAARPGNVRKRFLDTLYMLCSQDWRETTQAAEDAAMDRDDVYFYMTPLRICQASLIVTPKKQFWT